MSRAGRAVLAVIVAAVVLAAIGAGMLIAGIAVLAEAFRGRTGQPGPL